jgi:D-3-phosphoglycerate dehydrogenase
MKSTAFLINPSRGPVVDQPALVEALKTGIIAGAGLDVFEPEPPEADDPLLTLDNVILSQHALCWTDQCFAGIGAQDLEHVFSIKHGTPPSVLVDPDVVNHSEFQAKLERCRINFS